MSFQNCMELCLPPENAGGVKPHISGSVFTSHRNRPSTNNKHAAIDFNYQGGQPFNTKKKYYVYSPVSGVVTSNFGFGGRYGVVTIKDAQGFSHGILHLIHICVKVNQNISVGEKIGVMAGKGPKGEYHYDVHIHYQLRNNKNVLIDPVAYWDGVPQVYTEPRNPEDADAHADDPYHYNAEPNSGPSGNIEEYMPRLAGVSEFSAVQHALWTNRVPQHEPWPRTLMVDTENLNERTEEHEKNINHNPQFTDDSEAGSKSIGRIEGDDEIKRGKFWRR